MPCYQLYFQDEAGILHPIGGRHEAANKTVAMHEMMDLYWDSRLDSASCTPVVRLAKPEDHTDCDHSPCPYEVDPP